MLKYVSIGLVWSVESLKLALKSKYLINKTFLLEIILFLH
jgi:hypothetical protein